MSIEKIMIIGMFALICTISVACGIVIIATTRKYYGKNSSPLPSKPNVFEAFILGGMSHVMYYQFKSKNITDDPWLEEKLGHIKEAVEDQYDAEVIMYGLAVRGRWDDVSRVVDTLELHLKEIKQIAETTPNTDYDIRLINDALRDIPILREIVKTRNMEKLENLPDLKENERLFARSKIIQGIICILAVIPLSVMAYVSVVFGK